MDTQTHTQGIVMMTIQSMSSGNIRWLLKVSNGSVRTEIITHWRHTHTHRHMAKCHAMSKRTQGHTQSNMETQEWVHQGNVYYLKKKIVYSGTESSLFCIPECPLHTYQGFYQINHMCVCVSVCFGKHRKCRQDNIIIIPPFLCEWYVHALSFRQIVREGQGEFKAKAFHVCQ